jgi:4-amino-4-deoxy-L-arabinose transferase-like glycosyltransferase
MAFLAQAIDVLQKDATVGLRARLFARPALGTIIFAFVAACALSKLFAAWATGLAGDESYTIVIARTLALSYFDHPPLHQWIVHGSATLLGEAWWIRVPFLLMAVAINVPLYGMTRRLFGVNAALWALFTFNAAPYFMAWPDGVIVPDVPLFLSLAGASWAITEILFGPPRSKAVHWLLWLLAGLAFGCAGLSKYSALFTPIGLLCFFAGSPRHRRWILRPEPYAGAALAFAIFAPVIIWNCQNHWISFAFQFNRAAAGLAFDLPALRAFAEAAGAQVALLSPWIGVPLLIALSATLRLRDPCGAERFLLCLVAVPLLFFLLMQFLGKSTIPHWFNLAWLFAFPLLGRWLSAKREEWLRAWAPKSATLSVAMFATYIAYVAIGPFWTASIHVRFHDPTKWSYNWRGLTEATAWRASGSGAPSFLVVGNWRIGGKVGIAFGPTVPVCAFAEDPREFEFVCDTKDRLGEDALIVLPKEDAGHSLRVLASYFERLGTSEEITLGRGDRPEQIVTLARGYTLLRPYQLRYGGSSDARKKGRR